MDITGKTLIFRNEHEGKTFYNTSISNRDVQGNKTYMSINVQLPQNNSLNNQTMIDIKRGFLSFYEKHDGTKVLKLIVMNYEIADNNQQYNAPTNENQQAIAEFNKQEEQQQVQEPKKEEKLSNDAFANFGANIDIKDSDLPF